jgi:DNA repair protein RecO (recombination protein O)
VIEWVDEAVVLSARTHGEGGAIAQLLTRERGRHAGLVRGGASARRRGLLQAGNLVRATWRGRLAEHLGALVCEPVRGHAAVWLDDALRLAGIAAACALAEAALPEREPHPKLYAGLLAFLEGLDGSHWPALYVRWELGLLDELGFGLDLRACALTGSTESLAWVSPRSGRAVSAAAGEPWRDRLLRLPGFLAGSGEIGPAALADGLALTRFFLARDVFAPLHRDLPPARARLVDRLCGGATISGA